MRKKNSLNYDDFGLPKLNMPFIPNLFDFINKGQSDINPLVSGVKKVAKSTSFGFNRYDETPKFQKKRSITFERGLRLNSGEAPLSDYELYQYQNDSDYRGGQNKPPRVDRFDLF